MKILILNAGSSSLKFQLIESGKELETLFKGLIDAIGLPHSQIRIDYQNKKSEIKIPILNHEEGLKEGIKALLTSGVIKNLDEIKAIGHRVVHGGEMYKNATLIDKKVIENIKNLCQLAPLHNPANLAGILSCQKLFPKIKQIAVFDTAFHQTLPEKAFLYGLPYELYQKYRIRRYGFHGINHQHVSRKAIKFLKKKGFAYKRIISCHLGNGCSITAIKNGKSLDTSMGFTPLQGLIMGTRCGDIDPAIPVELCNILKKDPGEIENMLNKESGLKGISELSSDVRILHAEDQKGNPKARRALALFSYTLAKYITSYTAILDGVDALVFTAGIGENAYYLREEICKYLKHLHFRIDKKKNRQNLFQVNTKNSKPKIFVIPANEEIEIAKETRSIIKKKFE